MICVNNADILRSAIGCKQKLLTGNISMNKQPDFTISFESCGKNEIKINCLYNKGDGTPDSENIFVDGIKKDLETYLEWHGDFSTKYSPIGQDVGGDFNFHGFRQFLFKVTSKKPIVVNGFEEAKTALDILCGDYRKSIQETKHQDDIDELREGFVSKKMNTAFVAGSLGFAVAAVPSAAIMTTQAFYADDLNNRLNATKTQIAEHEACSNTNNVFYPKELEKLSEEQWSNSKAIEQKLGGKEEFDICFRRKLDDGGEELVKRTYHSSNTLEMQEAQEIINSAKNAAKQAGHNK